MKFLTYSLVILSLCPVALGNTLNIEHTHLNDLTSDPDAIYQPIKIEEEDIDPAANRLGSRKRFVITYSKVTAADINSSYQVSPDGESSYDLYSEGINGLMKDNLKLVDSQVIAIEYYLTRNFSVELSDTYRRYNMNGRQVGTYEGGGSGGVLGGSGSSTFGYSHQDEIHDVQIGAKYSVKVIDVPNFEFELGAKGTVGLVHIKSDSTLEYGVNDAESSQYDDIAGYSFGVGLQAKMTFFDNFFLSASVEQRNYVIAPMKHDNGSSQQMDQDGLLFFLGIGVQF